ncbi:MAG: CDP-glucose 4,6-dehydratase [Candidatus Scalinduaceae bacterium]
MNKTFWKEKKILVTGNTGFKGSWLSLWLQCLGANVIGYSLPSPTKPSLFESADVAKGMDCIVGDVRDLEQLKAVIAKYQPEIIIHMAAQSLVHYSYNNPVETYSTNVMGTVNILEIVRHLRCARVVIIVTSDKCYENKEWFWGYRENDPMGGRDPYSSSKGCAELVTTAYRNSYLSGKDLEHHGVTVASVRAGNVIAGGDWSKDRLIPDIMKAFIENQPVIIRNPNYIRPWQHVLEPLNGYLCLIEHLWEQGPKFADAWNFGPNDEDARPVSWIVETLISLWGGNASWKLSSDKYPHESNYLKLDCSKARRLLKWSPKLNIATTLKWIAEWYQYYQQNKDMRNLTVAEIVRFENLREGRQETVE